MVRCALEKTKAATVAELAGECRARATVEQRPEADGRDVLAWHQGATGAGPRQEVAGPESGGPGRLTGEAKPQEILCSPGVAVAPTLLSPGEALGPQPGLAHGCPAGLAYICEGLKEQKKGLETLVLWNNQLTHTGMAFLGMTLVSRAGRGRRAPRLPQCLSVPPSAPVLRTLRLRDPSQESFQRRLPLLSFQSLSTLRKVAFLTSSLFFCIRHGTLVLCFT